MLMPRDRLTYRPLGRPTVVQGVFALCGSVDSSGNASFSALPSGHQPSRSDFRVTARLVIGPGTAIAFTQNSRVSLPTRQSAGKGRLSCVFSGPRADGCSPGPIGPCRSGIAYSVRQPGTRYQRSMYCVMCQFDLYLRTLLSPSAYQARDCCSS